MDTLFLLVAAVITLAALNVGETGARDRRVTTHPFGGDQS